MNVLNVPFPNLAEGLARMAATGVHTGADEDIPTYVASCTLDVSLNHAAGRGVRLMYTRDIDEGLHSLRLSMSFRLYRANKPLEFDHRFARHIAPHFFGELLERVLVYPPQFPKGKEFKVWHFRLFTDNLWRPSENPPPQPTGPAFFAWPDYAKALFR